MSSIMLLPNNASGIARSAELLQLGCLVAFPTETVYGLGADARNDSAVASIYAAKGRPSFNPLIVHLPSQEEAEKHGIFSPLAKKLAKAFWPGPFTLVVERKKDCALSLLVSAGLDSVALRVPANQTAQTLLKEAAIPIAAPSANRSGRISPTLPEHVLEELPEIQILAGGACSVGLESTVVDARGETPVLLRSGSVTPEQIAAICGVMPLLPEANPENFHSPGMLKSHYAPERPVRLNIISPSANEALLAFGHCDIQGEHVLNLSVSGDLTEAAANLFAYLRKLDKPEYTSIAIMPIPQEGLGLAINDRLERAAADRI